MSISDTALSKQRHSERVHECLPSYKARLSMHAEMRHIFIGSQGSYCTLSNNKACSTCVEGGVRLSLMAWISIMTSMILDIQLGQISVSVLHTCIFVFVEWSAIVFIAITSLSWVHLLFKQQILRCKMHTGWQVCYLLSFLNVLLYFLS